MNIRLPLVHKWQIIALDVIVRNVSFAKSDAVTNIFSIRYIHVIHSSRTMIEIVASVRRRPEWFFIIVTIYATIMRVTRKVVSTVRWFLVMIRRSPWHYWAPSYLSGHNYHYLSETRKRMVEILLIPFTFHFNKHL